MQYAIASNQDIISNENLHTMLRPDLNDKSNLCGIKTSSLNNMLNLILKFKCLFLDQS